MSSFQHSKRPDKMRCTIEDEVFLLRISLIFLFLRAVVNIPIQTSIISPWLIFRKMIISQLELGIFIGNLTVFFITERGRKYSHTNSHDFAMALILQDDDLTAGAWATCGLLCLSLSPQGAWRRFACSPAVISMWYPRTWSSPTKSLLTSLHSHLWYDLKLFYRNKTFPKRYGRANFNFTSIKTIRSWIVV